VSDTDEMHETCLAVLEGLRLTHEYLLGAGHDLGDWGEFESLAAVERTAAAALRRIDEADMLPLSLCQRIRWTFFGHSVQYPRRCRVCRRRTLGTWLTGYFSNHSRSCR